MNKNQKHTGERVLPDEAIVEMYWARNEQAIEETDLKYRRFLYSIAQNILHDRMDCEECLNDTYLGAWNSIPPSRPKLLGAFVGRIARNLSLKKYRDARADKRIPSELTVSLDEIGDCFGPSASAAEERELVQISEILNTYVKSLSDRQEFVFVCRYYCSDSVSRIAKMLSISESTVFRDLGEIREGLKKQLKEAGYYDAK